MLGVVEATGRGEADRLLAALAERLDASGVPLAGAIQFNAERDDGRPCDMDLVVLAGGKTIRISQNLGPMSKGCRLDPAGLEEAVGLVESALRDGAARLLIINKFGKQEAEGRGFRPAIGLALSEGVPVVTAVKDTNREAFDAFAGGEAMPLKPELDSLEAWCRTVLA